MQHRSTYLELLGHSYGAWASVWGSQLPPLSSEYHVTGLNFGFSLTLGPTQPCVHITGGGFIPVPGPLRSLDLILSLSPLEEDGNFTRAIDKGPV